MVPSTDAHRSIPYQPSLDGLRAIAVTLVLLFHGGFTWMGGGYVGVSVFFTLSGYLITALLLSEFDRSGNIALGTFYARRMKRLLPASLVCLVAVAVAAAAGVFDVDTALRRDLFGALFQVANWVKLFGDGSYADLTNATLGRVGPLEHYWSLAIEEQFYWIWPLVMVAMLRRVRGGVGRLRFLAGITVVAAIVAPLVARVWGPDAAYWSTPARAGEILVGATVAAALSRYRAPRRWAGLLTVGGLAAVAWAAVTWPSASGPAYAGWLPAFALATAAVIVGVQHPSMMRRTMSVRPLVWVGSISYGLYLYHWPLFAVLTDARLGVDGWKLFSIRMTATVAVAALSAVVVERPVRSWSPPPLRPVLAAVGATALVALAVTVVVVPAASTRADLDGAALVPVVGTLPALDIVTATMVPSTVVASVTPPPAAPGAVDQATSGPTDTTVLTASPVSTPVPVPTRPVRVIVLGDSTAEALGVGLVRWATEHPDTMQVSVAAAPGCGFIRSGEIPTDGAIDFTGRCNQVLGDEVPALIRELAPDVAILMVTMRDVEDRIWSADEGAIAPSDPRFRQRLLDDYRAMADNLIAAGVHQIVWVHAPNPAAAFQGEQRKMRDPARYRVQFDVIDEVASERPEVITALALHDWMAGQDLIRNTDLRPDGMHLTPDAAHWVTDVYLAGWTVSAALR